MADVELGSDVLRTLDRGLGRLREAVAEIDGAVQTSSAALLRAGDAEVGGYRRLAELRLAELARGGVVQSLSAVSERVRAVLERREDELASLGRELEALERRLAELEAERERQRERVASAVSALDALEGEVQTQLAEDEAYAAQLEQAERADAIADEAERKTSEAEHDRVGKGAPYEADPLFMYLWRRGFGTAAYSANPLARLLDRAVARLIGFDRARPNYWMLLEIPTRLRAHAERVRAVATAEFDRLKALELAAADAAGVPPARAAVEAEERRLDELDDGIEAAERSIAELRERRAAYAAGEDASMRSALEMLAAELRSAGVEALRRQAAATPSAEDDRVVADIVEHEEERERLEAELAQHKQVHARYVERLRELEDVRREFKRHRYDDLHSVFVNGNVVALTITEFLRGTIAREELWRAFRRHQRFRQIRSRPTFGTGGFPGRHGSWGIPRAGGWNMPRLPRGGGFGGGGFGRGGGFGGGGFKTGGGF